MNGITLDEFTGKSAAHMWYAPGMDFFTPDGLAKLKAYLGQVKRGQPKVWTAPFAGDTPISQVMDEWLEYLVSIRKSWPTLWDYEIDLSKKVGPMSIQKPLIQRIKDVKAYYDDILLPSEPIDKSAIAEVIDEFRAVAPVRLRSEAATLLGMKKSTNSGNPYFAKRRNVQMESLYHRIECTPRDVPEDVQFELTSGEVWNAAAILGWRGQEGGPSEEDVKQRVVWMFPFTINLAELQYYQPFIESCQRTNTVPAWVSNDAVDREITRLFDTKRPKDLVVCTDFTRFDQHFNHDMQNAAAQVYDAISSHSYGFDQWLSDVWPIKYNIPIILGTAKRDLLMLVGEHGMGSGSGGTNSDETTTHKCLQHEAARRKGKRVNRHSVCLGDDGCLSYENIRVEDVVESYASHGQVMNPDKQYASTQDCVFLRRWHHTKYRTNGVCVGVYSTCRAIGRLRYLERFMDPEFWSPEMVALRQLSIIENCKWHPLFHEFIDFCMKRDKYRLGIDIPGFMDNIEKLAIEATDHMQDFLGYTKTLQGETGAGITNWEVVKYLKSK